MKISKIKTYANQYICIVQVRGEDGSLGWGQTAPYQADITALILHRQVAPHVLGQSVEDPADIGSLV